MTNNEDRAALQKNIDQYRSNLRLLESQVAQYGGEAFSPLILINQLRSTREQIEDLQARLRESDVPQPQISFGSGNDQRGATITIGEVAGGNIIKGNIDLPQLRQLIVQYFSDSELRDLCFDLGIDYDSLSGSGKGDKARELVFYAQRHGVMADLIAACRRQRPKAPWPGSTATDADSSAALSTTPQSQLPNRGTEAQQQNAQQSAQPVLNSVSLGFETTTSGATITWGTSLLGRRRITPFTPPYDEATLPLVIKALDAVQHPEHPNYGPRFSPAEQAILAGLELWQDDHVPATAHRTVGRKLYEALGADGQNILEMVRNVGIFQRLQTSYILRFPEEAVNIAALPWEALWDRNRAILLSRGNDIDSCERYLDIAQAVPQPLPQSNGIHLLALSPDYNVPPDIREEERAARMAAWQKLQRTMPTTIGEINPLTVRSLTNYLRDAERPPDVIHYYGHGTYRDGQGYLYFDDGNGGKKLVNAERLAAILGDVRLVVLQACRSARVSEEGGLLTGIAPALSIVTGAVVAMQLTVRITAATRFSEVFYDELLRKRRSLQDAVAEARQTLFFEEDDGASWYVPTLYIRSQEQKPVFLVN